MFFPDSVSMIHTFGTWSCPTFPSMPRGSFYLAKATVFMKSLASCWATLQCTRLCHVETSLTRRTLLIRRFMPLNIFEMRPTSPTVSSVTRLNNSKFSCFSKEVWKWLCVLLYSQVIPTLKVNGSDFFNVFTTTAFEDCHSLRIKAMECIEFHGLARANQICKDYMDDFHECKFSHFQVSAPCVSKGWSPCLFLIQEPSN